MSSGREPFEGGFFLSEGFRLAPGSFRIPVESSFGYALDEKNERVYIAGGYVHGWSKKSKELHVIQLDSSMVSSPRIVETYDLPKKDHGDGVVGCCCVFLNDRIFVIGGSSKRGLSFQNLNEVHSFHVVTKQWQKEVPMNVKRWGASAVVTREGNILVSGGFDGTTLNSCEEYDVSERRWTILSCKLKYARGSHVSFRHGSHVFVVGGDDEDYKQLKTCEVLDMENYTANRHTTTTAMKWKYAPGLQQKRKGAAAALVGDYVLVAGAIGDGGGPSSSCEMIAVKDLMEGRGKWRLLEGSTMIRERCYLGAILLGDFFMAFGGDPKYEDSRTFETLNISSLLLNDKDSGSTGGVVDEARKESNMSTMTCDGNYGHLVVFYQWLSEQNMGQDLADARESLNSQIHTIRRLQKMTRTTEGEHDDDDLMGGTDDAALMESEDLKQSLPLILAALGAIHQYHWTFRQALGGLNLTPPELSAYAPEIRSLCIERRSMNENNRELHVILTHPVLGEFYISFTSIMRGNFIAFDGLNTGQLKHTESLLCSIPERVGENVGIIPGASLAGGIISEILRANETRTFQRRAERLANFLTLCCEFHGGGMEGVVRLIGRVLLRAVHHHHEGYFSRCFERDGKKRIAWYRQLRYRVEGRTVQATAAEDGANAARFMLEKIVDLTSSRCNNPFGDGSLIAETLVAEALGLPLDRVVALDHVKLDSRGTPTTTTNVVDEGKNPAAEDTTHISKTLPISTTRIDDVMADHHTPSASVDVAAEVDQHNDRLNQVELQMRDVQKKLGQWRTREDRMVAAGGGQANALADPLSTSEARERLDTLEEAVRTHGIMIGHIDANERLQNEEIARMKEDNALRRKEMEKTRNARSKHKREQKNEL